VEWKFITNISEQPTGPIFKRQQIKGENTAQLTLTDTILLWGLFHYLIFLKKDDILEAGSVSIFRQRST
jgi:hypothetical protein